jgi:hypothetical protein
MGMLIGFIEKTWFLWWIFAVIVILRWFSAASVDPPIEPYAPEKFPHDRQSGQTPMNQQFAPKAF